MQYEKLEPVRVNPVLRHPDERREKLDGSWSFRLDPDDVGVHERWFENLDALADRCEVPGCWQGQGHGGEGNDRVWDFGMEERVYRATYKGTGWYGRSFTPPDAWRGARVQVLFGGVHPSAEIWLNGEALGENDMPFVPFGFDITKLLRFGSDNTLIVRVHEAARIYGLAYGWQGNWSGLYRSVELTATGVSRMAECAVYPDVATATMRVAVALDGVPPKGARIRVRITAIGTGGPAIEVESPGKGKELELRVPVPSPRLWSPDAPNLYRADVTLSAGEIALDALSERVGFVTLSTGKNQFLINGEPYCMRGTGDFISCPETGSPDTDRDRWRRKLQTLRDYGYNHVRCQSYVYGPEYYDAADEVGLLIQSEMGILGGWGGHTPWHVYQWPKPTPDHYPTLKRQWDMVVQRDVNHPSANLYCMSNEYGKSMHFPRVAWECYHGTKAIKPTAMVIWTDGGFNTDYPSDFVNDEAARVKDTDLPVIQHEFRWWSSLPDPATKRKYAGAVLPYAVEIAEREAARNGLSHILPAAVRNSQRLQLLEAKAKMEACRRDNPKLAGISHFNAMDAALSPQGVIDEFYERKLASAEEWQRANGDTIIMCSLGFDQHVVGAGDMMEFTLSVSDYSHPPMKRPKLEWRLEIDGCTAISGTARYSHRAFTTKKSGTIQLLIPAVAKPTRAKLSALLREGERSVRNEWDLWVMPGKAELQSGVVHYGTTIGSWLDSVEVVPAVSEKLLANASVVLTEVLDEALVAHLKGGGKVILASSEGLVRPHGPNFGYVHYFFTPPANYGPYEDGQNATIISRHPMFGDFPHDGYADFQFFRLMETNPPLDLGGLGLTTGEPVIRVFHRYPVCHSLGYVLEYRVGKGTLIVCALGLDQKLPEARYLLAAMCRYVTSTKKQPAKELPQISVDRLVAATRLPPVKR